MSAVTPGRKVDLLTRYLLDTNIISNVASLRHSEALVAWMAERADEDLFVSS